MKSLHFLIRLACLSLSIHMAAAEGIGAGERIFSSIRLHGTGLEASFGMRNIAGKLIEAGSAWSFADGSIEDNYLIFEGKDYLFRAGPGRPGEGRLLRRSPQQPPAWAEVLSSGSSWSSTVVGRSVFFSTEHSTGFLSWGKGASLAELPDVAGLEFVAGSLSLSAGIGAGLSFTHATPEEDGWKPRALRMPAMHHAVIATSLRASAPPGRLDLWVAGSAGEALKPGLALAASLESAPDSDYGMRIFGFAASQDYRNPGGTAPVSDAAMELSARAEAGTLALNFRLGLRSVQGYPSWLGYRSLRNPTYGTSSRDTPAVLPVQLLLLCEPDLLSASLAAGFPGGRLAADLAGDRTGLSRAGILARLDLPAWRTEIFNSRETLRSSLTLKATFAGSGREENASEPDWLDESSDDELLSEVSRTSVPARTGLFPSAFLGNPVLSSLRVDTHLAAGEGKTSLSAGISVHDISTGPEFHISGRLSLRAFRSSRAGLDLRISTPPGGYLLSAIPDQWPVLSAEYWHDARPSRNRLPGI